MIQTILTILLPINFLFALYMAYRLIKVEERNAVFLPLVGVFLSTAILAFQEFQILLVNQKVVIEYFSRTHTVNSICILMMAMSSSIAFLNPNIRNKGRVRFYYSLVILPALLLLFQMGFNNDFSHTQLVFVDGQWHYQLDWDTLLGKLFISYTFAAVSMISVCYWIQFYNKKKGRLSKRKIGLLALQSLINFGTCIAFVLIPQFHPMLFAASIPISICAIALTWIYNNFSLGNINSSLALNDILNSMSNVLIITNKDLEIVEINNEALKMFQLSKDKMEGKPMFNLVRKFNIDNWKPLARTVVNKRNKRCLDQILKLHFDENHKFINVSVKPHYNRKNEIAGFVFIGSDVTEVHQQQLAIQEHTKNLERTNKELERFAYIASHDLKTPLRSVVSFLDLIERRIVKYADKDLKEFVYLARQGASQMYHLIQDILEFSRVDRIEEEKVAVDLNDTVFNICRTLQPTLLKKNAELLISDLPMIKAEKTHMTQLFTNLIENGLKYNDGQKPVVKVNYRTENNRHLFAVSDNGIGVEQKYYDQIFEMFKRLHTNPNHEGSGIGLSICKKIVDIYKGEIWLESKVNEGTTFFFTMEAN